MKNTLHRILATVAAVALPIAVPLAAQATSFVNEATQVVDQVTEQGQQANGAIDAFYQDFSQAASEMVDLEARVESWRQQGYLCPRYAECPEKHDLIYAYYGKSMARIQSAFERHREEILASLGRFNRMVYEGKDRLADLRSDDLAATPVELQRLRRAQEVLKTEKAALEANCPDRGTRACARQWRSFERKVQQAHRQIRRLAYTRKLAELRERMVDRLEVILGRYGELESDAVATLADYAFIFEQYGEIAGTQGIGQLLAAAQDLGKLESKLKQMQDFGKGLEVHVLDVGNLMNERLDQIAGEDLEVSSRSDLLTANAKVLEQNERLLRELEKEVGHLQAKAP